MFDHLFYPIYWWNQNVVKERSLPVFSSLLGVSVFKVLNISTLIFSFLLLYTKDIKDYPKWLYVLMMLAVLITNYFIYIHKRRYKEIIEESKNQGKQKLRRKDIILVIYIIVTFLVFFYVVLEGRKLTI